MVSASDIVFVSVKPSVVPSVLDEVKSIAANKLFVSVAMGITIQQMETILPNSARVVRVMPNTPALVNQGWCPIFCSTFAPGSFYRSFAGCSVFVRGTQATETDGKITHQLLQSIGTCDEVTENLMDAVTGLSGSGPAYVFVMIEALADGGVKMGLPRDLAYRLAAQTVLGAGQLVRDSGIHPGKLKDGTRAHHVHGRICLLLAKRSIRHQFYQQTKCMHAKS